MLSRRRKWAFRLAAMTLVPALVFGLLELGLRVCGFGYPTGFFVPIPDRDAYTTNQKFGWRFFPPAIARAPAACELPGQTTENTYRIFVLGGSAAMGTPNESTGFARMLEAMLREAYPDVDFQVVNAAMTAINSHVVLPIARDCARQRPDLFVVYMGNNEVVGPYGPGTVFAGFSPSLSMIRASIFARSTRIGELIEGLLGWRDAPAHWGGLEMFLDEHVAADDPRLEKTYRYYRANLEDICRAGRRSGAEVVVCTVATNLKDCPPFHSLHRADLSEADRAAWDRLYAAGGSLQESGRYAVAKDRFLDAAKIDDRYAELQFRIGTCLLAFGEPEKAREHFLLARDLDALRFRADSRINQIVREVGGGDDPGVHLLDIERVFEGNEASPEGVPGCEVFYEHVHLTPDGDYLVAKAVFEQVAALLPERIRASRSGPDVAPTKEQCFRRLAMTDWDRFRLREEMVDMVSWPPFTGQFDHERRLAEQRAELSKLTARATDPAALAATQQLFDAALEQTPGDLDVRRRFARFLNGRGDYDGAVEQWRILLARLPGMAKWRIELASVLRAQDKLDEALSLYEEALRQAPKFAAVIHYERGLLRLRQGKLKKAEGQFRQALAVDPRMTEAQEHLGAVLLQQGNTQEAIDCFRRLVELAPSDAAAHNNLGAALRKAGNSDEAAEEFAEALRLYPDHLAAHSNMASVELKRGNASGAIEHFRQMVRIAPDDADFHYQLGYLLAQSHGAVDAKEEFHRAVQLDPTHVRARTQLAVAMENLGQTAAAVEGYRKALELDPDCLPALHNLAAIRATHPDAQFRDAEEALRTSKRLCALTGDKDPECLGLLAAAYAEADQFEEAVAVSTRAVQRARAQQNQRLAAALESRLALYSQQRPFRRSEQSSNE